MDIQLINQIKQSNPWLGQDSFTFLESNEYIERLQAPLLLKPEWDPLWLLLLGPRQAGKTTLGKHVCEELIQQGRFNQLLYLNCDYPKIREWLNNGSLFLQDIERQFKLKNYILFIDEVQRLDTPGLLLKIIADLRLPIKMIATGSSQLEIKSKVQEFLTGRQLETLILPLSCREADFERDFESIALYGSYPQIYKAQDKRELLAQLYESYIAKDIIEILRIGKPDVMRKLVALVAHSSGRLVNYQQLAVDCQVNVETLRNYLDILEKTYVLKSLKPFVGNKRSELTSNPVYYFIDNGFRNQTLNNFSALETRTDAGLLIESLVFQEIYKYKTQTVSSFDIYYWRTKGGAEVDFVLSANPENQVPVEVKYRNLKSATVSRGFRSFIEAYQPRLGIILTKNMSTVMRIGNCDVHFVPLSMLSSIFSEGFFFPSC